MDERFHQGIRDFNSRCFFEAHDIWEDYWHEYREIDRLCLQGLIQVAVGFYHLGNNNYKGCCSQFSKALAKIEQFPPRHFGIETGLLIGQVRQWLALAERLRAGEAAAFAESDFPQISYLQNESAVADSRSSAV